MTVQQLNVGIIQERKFEAAKTEFCPVELFQLYRAKNELAFSKNMSHRWLYNSSTTEAGDVVHNNASQACASHKSWVDISELHTQLKFIAQEANSNAVAPEKSSQGTLPGKD